ncbi:MAG TPA: GNAT family N-acetyltransferase [Spirochaetales bacterium]|jgi:ribosomal protein S18 acetylase RimI-like enzyme|nr:GNAT family N-acetyltransferase [Spirochaetales bacterium]
MTHIVAYRKNEDILSYEEVVSLVQHQMAFIGYSQSREQVASEIRNSMKEESRSALFVAYEEDGTAMGFAYGNICCGLETRGDYFWLNELFVSVGCRQQGLGSELLRYVQTWAKEHGCAYLALVTHPNNKKAQALYRDLGFELEQLVWVDTYL